MNKTNKYIFTLFFALLVILQTVSATTVSIENICVEPGGNAIASVMINNVSDLGVADINLTFNSSVISISAVDNSDFDFHHAVINNSNGIVRIGAFQMSSEGLNGDVKLADVIMDAVGSVGDTSILDIYINELKEIGTPETAIPAQANDGTFAIINAPDAPTMLSDTTGILWINWTWTSCINTDFVEVKINGTWVENCTKSYYNDTYPPHSARTISLRGYNLNLDAYSEYVSQTTTIPNHAPTAVASSIYCYNNVGSTYISKAVFDASASSDPDGSIAAFAWDFGDMTFGTGASTEHVYSSYNWNGTGYDQFMVNLTVTDDINPLITDTIIIPVNVYIAGDTNGDGEVNIYDGTTVGSEWNKICEDVTWTDQSDRADLNNNCIIDIFDGVIVGSNWGNTA